MFTFIKSLLVRFILWAYNKKTGRSFKVLIESFNAKKHMFKILTINDLISIRQTLIVSKDPTLTRMVILLTLATKRDDGHLLIIELQHLLSLCIEHDSYAAAVQWANMAEYGMSKQFFKLGSITAFDHMSDGNTYRDSLIADEYRARNINAAIATYVYTGTLLDNAIKNIKKEWLWAK